MANVLPQVLDALRDVYDPCCREKGITVVDKGLVRSAKLADDFSRFIGAIDADLDHLFAELYRNWYFAFCLAENCGAVQLS